jgi:hypothetical protein
MMYSDANSMKTLNATAPETRHVLTVEALRESDSWEYKEVLWLVENGDLPSVEAYVADMNHMLYQSSNGVHGIPRPEADQRATQTVRKAAPQARRAAQRSKE